MPRKTEPAPARPGVRIPIEELTPDPRNARVHDRPNIDGIKASLARWGQQRRILIDANNVVVAGNGTVQAARELGWAHIDADITDLEGDEARAYAVADNRLAELASWEDRQLAETLEAIRTAEIDLAAVGYTDAEIDALVARLGDEILAATGTPAEDPGPQPDRAEELLAKWRVEPGDLWAIPSLATPGKEHRLLCGDSTKAEDVAKACDGRVQGCFTSPPYAEQRKEQYGGTPADKYVEWWDAIQANVRKVLWPDGSFFVNIKAHCEDGERNLYVMDLVTTMKRKWGWAYVDELAWVRNGVPGGWPNRFKNAFEPIHQFSPSAQIKFCPDNVLIPSKIALGERGADKKEWKRHSESAFASFDNDAMEARPSNVIEEKANCVGVLHSAPFPVGLPEFFLKAFSDPGDIWYDPFCGSGTTIVAAEQTGRLCRGVEISPKYCAVILERLEGMGLRPFPCTQGNEQRN